jgi:hypothetical protein
VNGPWVIRAHGGSETPYPGENPYGEVSSAKYALSDEMTAFQKSSSAIPTPRKGRFYTQFDAAVCICPDIASGSSLPTGDFKCWIWGFPTAVEKVCNREIESSWNAHHWELFARDHLTLEAVSLEGATDSGSRSAEQMLSAYNASLMSLLSHCLPPDLVNIEKLPQAEHFVLFGPSGIGKSVRLQRYALESARQNALVLFVEAMHYTGEFKALLQKAVAPSFAGRIEELRHAASTCAATTVLIVDGFDRCKESLRSSLVRDVVAFHKLSNCRVVVGSQLDPNLPSAIKAQQVQMSSLTPEQKLTVFQFHVGDPNFSDSSLLEPFETAHELMVVAKCRWELTSGATRAELYDAYVAQCMPAPHATVLGALSRDLAAVLSRDFAAAMSLQEFEQAAESFVKSCAAPLQVVDEFRKTDLVKLSPSGFSFSHELIQEHLYSDWLCRTAEDFDALLSELRKPAHHRLSQTVLSRQKSPTNAKAILQTVEVAGLLMHAFRGSCGTTAKRVLLEDCHKLISDAAADLAHATLSLKVHTDGDKKMILEWPELKNCREWSAYETRLARFIGENVGTEEFADRAAELFALAGASFHAAAEQAAKNLGLKPVAVFDRTFHALLVLQGPVMKSPVSEIFHAWRHSLFASPTKPCTNDHWIKALISRCTTASSPTEAFVMFALSEAMRYAETPHVDQFVRVFQMAWNTRLRSLRVQALEMLEHSAPHILSGPPEGVERIRNLLNVAAESASGADMIFSTFMVDALNAYGLISPPVSAAEALTQMRGVLNPSSDYARRIVSLHELVGPELGGNALAEEAYRILDLFFEDVFQGVYFEAFHLLTEGEQTEFMNLAAQAKDPSFNLGYILGGLVKVGSSTSLPVFRKHAATIQLDSPMAQEAVSAFLLAVIGCAKLNAELPAWEMPKNDATEAWQIIRQIVYQHFGGASATALMDELWLSLRADAPLGAADALMNIEHSFTWGGENLRMNLVESYPRHVRSIMEHSLPNVEKLRSAWQYGQDPAAARQRADFVIAVLGRVGDSDTVGILRDFTDDPTLGKGAITAIKAIKARVDSKTPQLHSQR